MVLSSLALWYALFFIAYIGLFFNLYGNDYIMLKLSFVLSILMHDYYRLLYSSYIDLKCTRGQLFSPRAASIIGSE